VCGFNGSKRQRVVRVWVVGSEVVRIGELRCVLDGGRTWIALAVGLDGKTAGCGFWYCRWDGIVCVRKAVICLVCGSLVRVGEILRMGMMRICVDELMN